ncbi:MAG: TRAP transporter large permease subunit [Chloroflexi bacterium]|jgi:Na+/H+ antiporter NhaD/arsenite permease-like protein|nr:TRAP transporter large permease subunit [Chloroflexota bacterium]
MKRKTNLQRYLVAALLLAGALIFYAPNRIGKAQDAGLGTIFGRVLDEQGVAVEGAEVSLLADRKIAVLHTTTQSDGSFALHLSAPNDPTEFDEAIYLHIERPHFSPAEIALESADLQQLNAGAAVEIPDITLARKISLAFWLATVIFISMLLLIATDKLHNTLAALVGASLVLIISYLGHPISENLYIFDFTDSLKYIDWNVIFLIMGMMIVVAVVENTGIFQWLAFFAYRASRGNVYILLAILMLIAGVASAFLDNVTTMLLMTPITIQIAISMGINPLAFLLPEVMASNVVGISTLIGTPTNILIGSYADISFSEFLTNLTPGVLMAFIGLIIYSLLIYKKELVAASEASPMLLEHLAERGRITQPEHLKKAGWVGLGMLLLFIFGEKIHLLPAVTALVGATTLMVWIKPDIEEMIEAVDWTTLVFFMALFMVVGAIQEVGLISYIAVFIGQLVGENLVLAMIAVTWLSAILSMVIANIPFTAAMLPVVGFLTTTVPGAESKVLFFCLSVGSAMGGNGSLIGASANMIASGIAERAGYSISYMYFLKKGLPALLITVGLAMLWLLIKF